MATRILIPNGQRNPCVKYPGPTRMLWMSAGGESAPIKNPPTACASAKGQMFRCRAKISARAKPPSVVATSKMGLGRCAAPNITATRSELKWRL